MSSNSASHLKATQPEILIVDDSKHDRIYMRTVMRAAAHKLFGSTTLLDVKKDEFFQIKEVESAEDGIDCIVKTQARKTALILCDRLMPGKDGFEMFETLLGEASAISEEVVQRLRRIPKIIVTGSCKITDSHLKLLEDGVINGIFPKPIDRILPGSPEVILELTKEGIMSGLNLVDLSILHHEDDAEEEFLRKFNPKTKEVAVRYRNMALEAIGKKSWN